VLEFEDVEARGVALGHGVALRGRDVELSMTFFDRVSLFSDEDFEDSDDELVESADLCLCHGPVLVGRL